MDPFDRFSTTPRRNESDVWSECRRKVYSRNQQPKSLVVVKLVSVSSILPYKVLGLSRIEYLALSAPVLFHPISVLTSIYTKNLC